MPNLIGVGIVAVLAVVLGSMGSYRVPELHLGLFYIGGALQESVAQPGFQWRMPFVTILVTVPISFQTNIVSNAPCGTKGGVVVSFDRIEIVYRLNPSTVLYTVQNYGANYAKTWIADPLPALVNDLCSTMDLAELYILKFDTLDEKLSTLLRNHISAYVPGLEIITIRLTKPTIPESIREKYMHVAEIQTRVPVLLSKQKTEIKQLETLMKQDIIRANKAFSVAEITMNQKIEKQESKVEIEQIQANMIYKRDVEKIDSALYQTLKEAESNVRKLTPAYLNLQRATTMLQNTEIVFGDNIPSTILDGPVSVNGNGNGRTLPAPTRI